MLQQYKTNTNIYIGLGIGLNILARVIESNNPGLSGLSTLIIVFAAASMIWGCANYSQGKGYSPYWGALGLLSIFGLIALVLFPDRHKNAD